MSRDRPFSTLRSTTGNFVISGRWCAQTQGWRGSYEGIGKAADSTQIYTHMCYSEFNEIIESIARLPRERIWVNPDYGLKTRNGEETRAALANMVAATQELRKAYAEAKA
ncbi:MAG: hypothetical protein GYB38_02770 [Gammaproteobacteria bacterium]|nr:hypothetical protein [Gammaproteobacteria bacterium]